MADEKHGSSAFTTRKRNRIRGLFKVPFKKRRVGSGMNVGKTPSFAARKALTLVRRLQRAREIKNHDIFFVGINIPTTGLIFPMADVAQGDTGVLRDGNSMNVFTVDLRWQMNLNVLDVSSSFRVLVFRDTRQVSGVAPVVLNVLQETRVISQLNSVFRTRFDIMYDFTGVINTAAPSVLGHFHKKVQVKVDFTGSGATNVTKNGMYVLVICNEATNEPSFTRTHRILFNDF